MTVSKGGFGASFGTRGARYTVHSSGRRTTTIGIPGTGISNVSTSSRSSRRRSSAPLPPAAIAATVGSVLPKPGIFAGAAEKRYYEGILAYLGGNHASALAAFEAVLVADPKAVSAHLLAAINVEADAETPRVIRHLESVVTTTDPFPDKLMNKYLPPARLGLGMTVKIADFISARVPSDQIGASLVLAEAYQQSGRLEDAIGLIQQLHDAQPSDLAIRLSLADLLIDDQDYDGVVELTTGVTNDDDLGVSLLAGSPCFPSPGRRSSPRLVA